MIKSTGIKLTFPVGSIEAARISRIGDALRARRVFVTEIGAAVSSSGTAGLRRTACV
jgi:hypothetical protein